MSLTPLLMDISAFFTVGCFLNEVFIRENVSAVNVEVRVWEKGYSVLQVLITIANKAVVNEYICFFEFTVMNKASVIEMMFVHKGVNKKRLNSTTGFKRFLQYRLL